MASLISLTISLIIIGLVLMSEWRIYVECENLAHIDLRFNKVDLKILTNKHKYETTTNLCVWMRDDIFGGWIRYQNKKLSDESESLQKTIYILLFCISFFIFLQIYCIFSYTWAVHIFVVVPLFCSIIRPAFIPSFARSLLYSNSRITSFALSTSAPSSML